MARILLSVLFFLVCVSVCSCMPTAMRTLSSACVEAGGKCQDANKLQCATGYAAGLCPGAVNVQCCGANPHGQESRPSRSSSSSSSTLDWDATKSVCASQGGQCMDYRGNSCPSGFKSGMCPGPAGVQCCLSGLNFETLRNCYPQGPAEDVKKMIGGRVNAGWITNTCAIRMSHTLNCAGKVLDAAGARTISGGNRWQYYFRVLELSPVVRNMFGNPLKLRAGSSGRGVDKTPIIGKKGIIYFNTQGVWSDASGHFDLWDGSSMVESSHDNVETVDRYFSLSKEVSFWEFK